MGEISSGLVAVAWIAPTSYEWPAHFISTSEIRNGEPLVRLSDAEAIIAQKDVEILEQCRINGMGAERELALLGQIERQAERIKELEEQAQSLARSVMCDQVSNDSHSLFLAAIRDLAAINECLGLDPDDGGAVPIIDAIDAQSAALKLAKDAIVEIAHVPVGTVTTSYDMRRIAIAAIDALKGE